MEDLETLRAAAWRVFGWGVIAFACFPLIFYLFVNLHFLSSMRLAGMGSLIVWLLAVGLCQWRCRQNFPARADEADLSDQVIGSDGERSLERITEMLKEIWWIGFIFLGSPICFVATAYIFKSPSKFDLWEIVLVAIFIMNLERFLAAIAPLEIPITQRIHESQRSKRAINLTGWLLVAALASVVTVGVIAGAYAEALQRRVDEVQRRIDFLNHKKPPYTAQPPYTVPPNDGQ